jgi:hypothetical protein
MKIKVIAFPLLLAFSITLLIWFVKPEYDKYQATRSILEAKKVELAEIQEKKQKIVSLAESLAARDGERQIILRYLPETRNEEEIINGIDYLAKGAAVSLLNVNVESKRANAQPVIDPATGLVLAPKAEIVPITAELSLLGQYESIKSFLTQIYKMEKFNEISSVSISKVEIAGEEGQVSASASGILTLQAAVSFGYLPSAGADTPPEIFAPGYEYDYSIAKDILNLVKIPSIDVGSAGKTNPFLP